jgi:hypothetical protein
VSEPMWKKEILNTQPTPLSTQSTASMAAYTDAMNRFTKAATSFMEHVHLLTEARDAYQTAMTNSAEIRSKLDANDRTLRSLMNQLEQVVSAHLGEPVPDKKRPEMMKVEAIRTDTNGAPATGEKFLP